MKKNSGIVLLNTLVFGSIAIVIIVALVSWFTVTFKMARDVLEKEQAFHIAEAGVEYYRWHLAHADQDFQDGTGQPGPYIHDFLDKDGNKIGEYHLNIIPPSNGSTIVTIESTGYLYKDDNLLTNTGRTVRTKLAKPSFAKYAFVANSEMRFGEGTEVFGPIHSNEGIRFDGFAHNVISSSRENYDDPDHSGPNEWAVHTHINPIDPLYPIPLPNRFDVFSSGREVGVPAIDFAGITSDLADLKIKAQKNGRYFSSSSKSGYYIVLKTNDTFDLYRVDSLINPHSSCTNVSGDSNWGTWSINKSKFLANYNFPNNGVIFVEDHLWISGQINGARLTIVAARFPDSPTQRRSITINNDLTYTNYDGSDVIALLAQDDINIGMVSEDDLKIDAALIAQNGRIGRHYYRGPYLFFSGCSPYHDRDEISVYGMIGSNKRYGFAYTDGNGYDKRNITYDANLLYGPPPEFPLTSDQYETISWEEVE